MLKDGSRYIIQFTGRVLVAKSKDSKPRNLTLRGEVVAVEVGNTHKDWARVTIMVYYQDGVRRLLTEPQLAKLAKVTIDEPLDSHQ